MLGPDRQKLTERDDQPLPPLLRDGEPGGLVRELLGRERSPASHWRALPAQSAVHVRTGSPIASDCLTIVATDSSSTIGSPLCMA